MVDLINGWPGKRGPTKYACSYSEALRRHDFIGIHFPCSGPLPPSGDNPTCGER